MFLVDLVPKMMFRAFLVCTFWLELLELLESENKLLESEKKLLEYEKKLLESEKKLLESEKKLLKKLLESEKQ